MIEQRMPYAKGAIHTEIVLEQHLVDQLVDGQGYLERTPGDYDRVLALDKQLVLRFVQDTQPAEWKRLTAQYAAASEATFFKQLEKTLKEFGTLHVLREGIKLVPNIRLRLCFFKPASNINPELTLLYGANILSAIRQLRYSQKHDNELDIGLFVNGLPVATLEFKNLLTGSSYRTAEAQYKKDRTPVGEPLLTFNRGALVHFALDEDNVSMTTKLRNGQTRFLPFNRGRDGGAGNPDVPGEFRIAYLYKDLPDGKAIFGRDAWLGILGRFVHVERKDDKEDALIFPRFQQLDAVMKLMSHARSFGSGHNYLIQHSAGSGKSNTIAWTAHQSINLHNHDDRPIFDTAIIVTDRLVLDAQLQETVAAFAQTPGVVKKIDGTSKQLKAALESGARIIVTTIQKFGTDHLKEVSGQSHRTFALLIDEAHSSQSGESAQSLANALSREEQSGEDVEDVIAAYQKSRGPQPNISYFAFTATPRNVTLERFGTRGADGLPHPFHLYSMRQAIEEGFILDVLRNYMTYKAYYELEKAIDADPTFKTKKAQRKVARFAHLHPTAIGQKVEVIVEHFHRHVAAQMDGHAKGMVVTGSRESALRTFFGMRKYIAESGYTGLKALVAFSSALEVDGETWTEAAVNGFSESQLTEKFEGDDFQLLIVAEKYQTGFDQPKLCAMYVDRKLAGLQAVQTLSRLNRTAPDKDKTFILDFQNTVDEIRDAFKPYYEITAIEESSDPSQIYTLETRLKKFGIIDVGDVNRFAGTYFKYGQFDTADRIALERLVRHAVARWETIDDQGKQEEFRQLLKSYVRFYSFISQVVHLQDTELEKLAAYGAWLARLLPDRELPPEVDVTEDMIRLKAFRVNEQNDDYDASLKPGDTTALLPINEFGANTYTPEEEVSLSAIITSFNLRHGTQFTKEDFLRFEEVNREVLSADMLEMLRNNPADVVYSAFSDAFFKGAIKLFQRDAEMKNIVLSDPQARKQATEHFFSRALRAARA